MMVFSPESNASACRHRRKGFWKQTTIDIDLENMCRVVWWLSLSYMVTPRPTFQSESLCDPLLQNHDDEHFCLNTISEFF
jgi:hypothetical protein